MSSSYSKPAENNGLQDLLKRIFDLLVAASGLLLLLPLFLVVGILIKRESPGPVFYLGPRAGRGGKVFKILKFRTMHERPESYRGAAVTAQDDARITPLGRKLRDSKLNEFPQLWNVLKGEMSLVGPRPEDPEIVKTWPEKIRREILSVRPGITSPASVLYRNEEKLLSAQTVMSDYLEKIVPDKLRLDLLYVRTRNFLADIDIILYTLIALFPQSSVNPVLENKLYSGPLNILFRRYFYWFILDTLIALFATAVVGSIWRLSGPLNLGIWNALLLAVAIALFLGVINTLLGLKRISWGSASPVHIIELAFSTLLATSLVYLGNRIWLEIYHLPLSMFVAIGLLALAGFILARYRQRVFTGLASRWLRLRQKKNVLGERVLIVGAGEGGQLAAWLLKKSDLAVSFTVIGMVDDDPEKYHMIVDEIMVLGTTRDIPRIVEKMNIGLILFSISKIDPQERRRILKLCASLPVRVVVIPDLMQIIRENLMVSHYDPDLMH